MYDWETFVSVTEMCPVCITGSRTHAIQLKTLARCSRVAPAKLDQGAADGKKILYLPVFDISILGTRRGHLNITRPIVFQRKFTFQI